MKIESNKKPLTQDQVREVNVQLARIPVLEAALVVCKDAIESCMPILDERSWTPMLGPTACEVGSSLQAAMDVIFVALHPKKTKPVDKRMEERHVAAGAAADDYDHKGRRRSPPISIKRISTGDRHLADTTADAVVDGYDPDLG